MKEYDVAVIGGGLAGLMAAIAAGQRGKRTLLLNKGAGMLAIGGGIIDVLGYSQDKKPLASPASGFPALAAEHPYAKIGTDNIAAALNFFLELCAKSGYEYLGNVDTVQWLVTGAGTMKPSCLIPRTMNPAPLKQAERIFVIGFEGMKDYYPELIVKGLRSLPRYAQKQYTVVMLKHDLPAGRDISVLDIARWLDKPAGRQAFVEQVTAQVPAGGVSLIPPILGTQANYQVAEAIERLTQCRFVETASIPPAITGLRLRELLLRQAKAAGVTIIEKGDVAHSVVENNHCQAITTANIDRPRTYQAKSYILATGGFYGGGLIAEPGSAVEPIFNLPVQVPASYEDWSNFQLISAVPQAFAQIGITVDSTLRPLADDGRLLLDNVYIAGRNLAGYDFCFEKSGNGVALVSGYFAGMQV